MVRDSEYKKLILTEAKWCLARILHEENARTKLMPQINDFASDLNQSASLQTLSSEHSSFINLVADVLFFPHCPTL